MKNIIRFVPICLLFAVSCATLPKDFKKENERIVSVGPGPEDLVVDTLSGEARLLISCNARRKADPYYGEINTYNIRTGEVKVLKRQEPISIHFCPHGIGLVKVKDTLVLLVVNNDVLHHENAVLRYALHGETLVFLNKITDPLIVSPNAVTGFSDGTVLISNDAGKQGNYMEALFILKRAKIVYWDYNKCTVAAGNFCYSNGITINGSKVYLASTRQNKIWQFDFLAGHMVNKRTITSVHGPDNLRLVNGDLYVACHLRFIDFIKHMQNASNYSPTTVYRVNIATGKKEVVYFDSGAKLSAGSTGMPFRSKLYVSGVFDAKMSVTDLK